MKKLVILFASMFIMTIAVQNVSAQGSASASSEATIITPISIVKNVDLNFGNIVALTTEETVTVAPDGTRSSSDPNSLPTATPGTITAAKFTVSDLADATYSITTPAAFNVTSGGNTMEVSTFVTNPTPTGVLTGGSQELTVGATIKVGASQAAGTYTNPNALVITVAYN